MSDFIKCIGAVTLMLSTVAVVFLTFCWTIEWYFTWVFSIFPIKPYLIPILLAHSFLFGGLVFLLGSLIELIGKIAFVVLIIPWAGYRGVILCEPLIWVAMTTQLYFSLFRHPLIKEGKAILATKGQS